MSGYPKSGRTWADISDAVASVTLFSGVDDETIKQLIERSMIEEFVSPFGSYCLTYAEPDDVKAYIDGEYFVCFDEPRHSYWNAKGDNSEVKSESEATARAVAQENSGSRKWIHISRKEAPAA